MDFDELWPGNRETARATFADLLSRLKVIFDLGDAQVILLYHFSSHAVAAKSTIFRLRSVYYFS